MQVNGIETSQTQIATFGLRSEKKMNGVGLDFPILRLASPVRRKSTLTFAGMTEAPPKHPMPHRT
jgi:hypothetical protein